MAVGASAISSANARITVSARRRDITELTVGYTLILLVIWTPRPWQRVFYVAAILWIAAVSILSFNGWRAMGLRLTNCLRSLWIIAVSLLLAAAAVLVGIRFHTLHRPIDSEHLIRLYWGYAIWSCLQQFLLQDFFLLRLLRLLPTTTGAVTAATALFALAHLPNPILTPATVIWGFIACLLFLRYRNLYPLAVSHIILGVCVAITVPNTLNHNMRVGLGYLHWHPPRGTSPESEWPCCTHNCTPIRFPALMVSSYS